MPPPAASPSSPSSEPARQHGVKGVYYGGEWLDMEDCDGKFHRLKKNDCSGCDFREACPRSASRNSAAKREQPTNDAAARTTTTTTPDYDVCIVGAGCIGASIARELSKYQLSVLLVEAADDVSQGATKGNSGIVHAGYDDKPGSVRAKHCWKGNQMFAALDRELRFGYQKNGSLVVAFNDADRKELEKLKQRGEINGVQNLRIVQQNELREMEPHIHPDAVAALYSPDAGNVIPYEFAIALAENAVDNGVELRIRTAVTEIEPSPSNGFTVTLEHWEPSSYVRAVNGNPVVRIGVSTAAFAVVYGLIIKSEILADAEGNVDSTYHGVVLVVLFLIFTRLREVMKQGDGSSGSKISRNTPLKDLVEQAGEAVGNGGEKVSVDDMLKGGSGSENVMGGQVVSTTKIRCQYIINCAGGASDQVARMIGDDSFKIKPRLGDYILLNRNQGKLAKHTLFPTPDPVLGKGVLVQTTLWGNLILGPTARDMYKPEARDMSNASVQEYILSKCKKLVPSFDPRETIHAFAGARAKSDRGDWIIEPSKRHASFINVAGIDSPGLAGSPSIALEVCEMLKKAGLEMKKDPTFKKDREPIITPKAGLKGLKMGPVGKFDSDGSNMDMMAANVICKCEKVTELEVVRAMRRSLPIDSSQAIRKRTRACMGHCQADPENYNCEARVRAIIARENGTPVAQVGGRPWPATSTLPQRWIDDKEKEQLETLFNK